jgi:hypothetical protein
MFVCFLHLHPKKYILHKVSLSFEHFEESLHLHDNGLTKLVMQLVDKQRPANTGDVIVDATNKFCNKLTLIGQASNYLYKVSFYLGWSFFFSLLKGYKVKIILM